MGSHNGSLQTYRLAGASGKRVPFCMMLSFLIPASKYRDRRRKQPQPADADHRSLQERYGARVSTSEGERGAAALLHTQRALQPMADADMRLLLKSASLLRTSAERAPLLPKATKSRLTATTAVLLLALAALVAGLGHRARQRLSDRARPAASLAGVGHRARKRLSGRARPAASLWGARRGPDGDDDAWDGFKRDFHKSYASPAQEERARRNFERRVRARALFFFRGDSGSSGTRGGAAASSRFVRGAAGPFRVERPCSDGRGPFSIVFAASGCWPSSSWRRKQSQDRWTRFTPRRSASSTRRTRKTRAARSSA